MSEQPYECQCKSCVAACSTKPGWFLPGEAEHAAELLGLSLEDFFRQSLAVDWYTGWEGPDGEDDNPRTVFVLSPALVGKPAGQEMPGNPGGRCVFLKDGRCGIHAAKPYECRMYFHGDTDEKVSARKRYIVNAWATEQARPAALLGRNSTSSWK